MQDGIKTHSLNSRRHFYLCAGRLWLWLCLNSLAASFCTIHVAIALEYIVCHIRDHNDFVFYSIHLQFLHTFNICCPGVLSFGAASMQ